MKYVQQRPLWVKNNLSKSYAVSVSPFEFVFGVTLAKAFACIAATILLLSFSFKSNAQETLAGLTSNGGPQGKGTLFNINTNGTGFSVINGFQDWGANPNGGVILGSDGSYWGMTNAGGTYGYGTIFKMTPAGAITVLHHFDYQKDGANPFGNLTLAADGNYYGLTSGGGANTYGTIFKITPAGVFTVMRHFSYNTDGANPRGEMVLGTDNNLYGITYRGGANGAGTIFKFTTTGTYTVIKSLTVATEGVNAQGSLVLAKDGNFYGITYGGGTNNSGTIFKVTPTGTLTVLRHLIAATDGSSSRSTLVQAADGFLYGMANAGGPNGNGTIFKISTTGAFTVLHPFVYTTEGGLPYGSLIIGTDGSLYGLNSGGGPNRGGTIFKVTTAGVLTVLRSLTLTTDGGAPKGTLLKGADGSYYGLTSDGGASFFGTAFKITATGTYTLLAKFSGSGGSAPFESAIQALDNGIYGTTSTGGTYNYGTIFKLCGGVTTTMFSFNKTVHGSYPKGSLIQASDSSFYGTTSAGGANGFGTIFRITRTGTFTVLRHLTAADGGYPQGALVQGSNGLLYGLTSSGGTNSIGVIFSISTTGVYKVLKQFTSATDGANPEGSLVKGKDSFFFGMTTSNGRIFKIAPGGTYSVLTTFTVATGNNPTGNLVLGKDGNFYGMTSQGGSSSKGTIFKVTPTGTLTVLRHLNGTTDGGVPKGSLVQAADGNFYGMTSAGGTNNAGTIFRISPTGTFAVIRQLNMATDGGSAFGALIIQKPVTLVATPQSITTTEDVAKAIVLAGTGGAPLTFTIVTQPKNGTITAGTTANRTYTPKANYSGKDSFYFTANVGCQSSPPAKVLINITAVNDAPVLATIGNKTVKAGVKLAFTATATDPDAGQTKTFSLITPPTGAAIVATTGAFTWTPTAVGTYTFKVRVTDNGSPVLFDEEQITVTVTATLSGAALSKEVTEFKEKTLLNTVKAYPNPATDKYNVILPEPVSKISAAIFDVHGAQVYNWKGAMAGEGRYELNIAHMPAGEYVVRLSSEKRAWVVKFIKL